jgi:ABC-2 type transport system ATP-binding protein
MSTSTSTRVAPTATSAVRLDGVVKRFGPVTAVAGLDLTVRPGEIVAFLGPNGAGKTTSIDMMLGLSRPDSGTVQILGGSPARAIAHGRVAAVMQTGGLLRDLTVAETAGWAAARGASSSDCGSPWPCCPIRT